MMKAFMVEYLVCCPGFENKVLVFPVGNEQHVVFLPEEVLKRGYAQVIFCPNGWLSIGSVEGKTVSGCNKYPTQFDKPFYPAV
jgi:hypothetical protein